MTSLWTFPFPPGSLRVNRRIGQHFGAAHKDVKAYRACCAAILAAVELEPEDRGGYPIHMHVTAILGPRQRLDTPDVGTFAKVTIDCLVARGVLRGDSSHFVNPFTASVRTDDRQHPRLEVQW